MKRLLLSMAVVCMSAMVWAQTTTDAAPMTAVDSLAAKIIIIPHIAITSDIPDPAQGLMMDRMKRILLKNGIVDTSDRSRFVLTVKSNVTDGEWTATVPPKYGMVVEFTFYVGDVESGILYGSHTIRKKVVADSEEDAYMQAVKGIRVSDPAFKVLIDKAKVRIVETLDARDEKLVIEGSDYEINWW